MKIVVLEPLGVAEEEIRKIAKPITDKGHELKVYNEKTTDIEVLKDRVKDSDILVIANSPLRREVIAAAENLKYISVAFTGFDHVDLEMCKERGISVSNAAGYSTPAVVELAFGLMISVFRNIVPLDKLTRDGGTMAGYRQREISGKTLGIIGTGAIGKSVGEVGLAFGCNVIAYSRRENEELKAKGVVYKNIEEVFMESDIITIHLPLNSETKGFVDEDKLRLMKEDSILINTARGPIIDNKALADVLNEEKIAGAGIDVFDMEPPLDIEYPLLNAKNIVVAPHIGFASEEAMVRRANIVFSNVDKWIEGSPQNIVL